MLLSKCLSFLFQYIVKCHGTTLLPQFLGMYRVSVDSEERYMLVMRNVFGHRLTVHRKYDLKVMGVEGPMQCVRLKSGLSICYTLFVYVCENYLLWKSLAAC